MSEDKGGEGSLLAMCCAGVRRLMVDVLELGVGIVMLLMTADEIWESEERRREAAVERV